MRRLAARLLALYPVALGAMGSSRRARLHSKLLSYLPAMPRVSLTWVKLGSEGALGVGGAGLGGSRGARQAVQGAADKAPLSKAGGRRTRVRMVRTAPGVWVEMPHK